MTNKMVVQDANELDRRIPKNLMLTMDGKPFVLKAGLEWKANQLFGLHGWSLKTEIIEYDRKEPYALVKAQVIVGDQVYENYGEASLQNVSNRLMHKYMLHMAITRAEARALRVATACGFTAVEELEQAKAEIPEGLKLGQDLPKNTAESPDSAIDEGCTNCNAPCTQKVKSWSLHKYGVVLCYDCQKLADEGEIDLSDESIADELDISPKEQGEISKEKGD